MAKKVATEATLRGKDTPRSKAKRFAETDALAEWIESVLPKTTVVRKPSGAMFQTGTKIFAFTRPDGVAMKLPEKRIVELVESRDASFLVMGTKTMREWVLVRYTRPGEYVKDGKLFNEAMKFVASLKK
ncbi:MAG TPA: hypothetical protein VFD98_08030 [Terracidiphilus sp.]|nr:hypothetical protein [Terracidiphilus sp.]